MARQVLGAIDIGTTSTRFCLFTKSGKKIASQSLPLKQVYPSHGWHQQDPDEYLTSTLQCIEAAVQQAGVDKQQVVSVGITNQRETTVVWDQDSGEALHNSIIWDDTRTHKYCESLRGQAAQITQTTGLVLSPYFSASKMRWLIDNVPTVKKAVERGTARFGTVESWMVYKLTREARYWTDISNASRTMLMDLKGHWSPDLLSLFNIPAWSLPEIKHNTTLFGTIKSGALEGVPITGCIGDQFAATIGHLCLEAGSCKNTYGTGSFLLLNTGTKVVRSNHGLLTTVIGQFGATDPVIYALEGAVEAAGSCIEWLIKQAGLVQHVGELETLATSVTDTGDVYFVPALSGLYAPYWDALARGCIVGLTHHTTKAHLVRAALEGICFRTAEGIRALGQDYGRPVSTLSADGGLTANKFIIQAQADLTGCSIRLPGESDLTALGAALTSGLGSGVYSSLSDIKEAVHVSERIVESAMPAAIREKQWQRWQKAVERAQHWAE